MEMQASRTLAVSQQQAWQALNDPEVLKLCIPGCEKVEPTGENQYAVAMALKIGPVSAKFAGKITLADIVPPESYTLSFDGSGGVAGFGKGAAQVRLEPLPDDAAGQPCCELHYTVQATVGGKIAQLGQRLIDGAAKSMAEDFFKRFDAEMQRRHPRADTVTAISPEVMGGTAAAMGEPAAASSSMPAALSGEADAESRSAKDIPTWVWAGLAVVLVGLGWWLL